MASASKFAAAAALAVGLVGAAPTAAAGEPFAFSPGLVWLDLGRPHWDLAGPPVWDDVAGAGRWAAPPPSAEPTSAAAPPDAAPAPRFEPIAYEGPRPARAGRAGVYGADFDGRITASGERFDMYRLTAASSVLPLGAAVDVVNTATGERVTVRINDRRPAAAAGEVITLSYAAANRLGLDRAPDAPVSVEVPGRAAGLTRIAAR